MEHMNIEIVVLNTRFARVVFMADSSFVVCINYVPNELIDSAMETFPMDYGSPNSEYC